MRWSWVSHFLLPMLLSSGPGIVVKQTSWNEVTCFLELNGKWGMLGQGWVLHPWEINLGPRTASFPISCMTSGKEYKDSLWFTFNFYFFLIQKTTLMKKLPFGTSPIHSSLSSFIHGINIHYVPTMDWVNTYYAWYTGEGNVKQDKKVSSAT